jgi:capsular exopolysaccharide synthesis family protein
MFDGPTPAARPPAPAPAAALAALPPAPAQDVHILDRLSAVFKHRRLAATVFVLTVTLTMVQSYSTTPMYSASARILINDERSTQVGGLNANEFWQESAPYYETQYQILQSRGLARRVVQRLELQNVPEFNGTAPARPGLVTMIGSIRGRVSAAVRALFSGPVKVEPPAPDETEQESALIGGFLGRVRVAPQKGTRLVDVHFTGADPVFVARAVNTLADEYVQRNLDLRLENTEKTLAWLADEIAKAEKKVTDAERAMAEYRNAQNALSLDSRQNLVVARLTQLNDQVTRARGTRIEKETLWNQVRDVDPSSDAVLSLPAIAQSPSVQEIRNRIATHQAEKVRQSARWKEDHPEMQKLTTLIENARQQLRAEAAKAIATVRSEYQSALSQERSLASSLEESKAAAMDLDRKSVDYTVLEREAETARQVYAQLLTQASELGVVRNSKANNVQVMDTAEVPKGPYTPNPRKDWMMAIALGLVLGAGLAFGIEYLDDTVKTPEDVTRVLRLPLLGLVPAVRGNRVPVLTEPVPHDFGEAFRSLRTSLVFTSGGQAPRIIAVTSSQPLEGKTTTACNLAIALAFGGARVLLVDADMRRPGLHKAMGMQNGIGLSHLLVGQARVRETVQRTAEPNLFVITAGRTPPNPSELLASERMRSFIANLSAGPFDWVIIDTPPALAVTDPVILTQAVAGVVFVIGAEMTRRAHAERALATLFGDRSKIIGAVLNRVDFDGNKYYYSRYYGYQYKSYYGKAEATA